MAENLDRPVPATLEVANVGGIDETTVEIRPGITVLIGPNATNRTSLLQALAATLGSDNVTLKGDAESGEVTLSVDGETYTRELTRDGTSVAIEGDPYLAEADVVDLYAVLLENNEVRRAVRAGEDLRELIMRPVDTEEINAEISRLVDERQEIDAELDRLDALAEQRSELAAERSRLQEELSGVEERLAEKRAIRADIDGDADGTDTEDLLEEKLDALRETRSDLEQVRNDLEIQEKSLDSLREQRAATRERYESLSAPDEGRIAAVEERIDNLRNRKASLKSTISELQQVIQFNDQRLSESRADGLDALGSPDGEEAAEELLPEEMTVTCWTCGSTVQRRRIAEMRDRLEDLRDEKRAERSEIVAEIDDLTETLADLESRREQRRTLASKLEDLSEKIDRRESNAERLAGRESELAERVEELEAAIERLQESHQRELLAVQQAVSELEFERDRLADRLSEVDDEIGRIEAELDGRSELEARREAIASELADLRTRIDRVERDAVERFNTHMAAVLDRLDYDNVERIWLESTRETVREGSQQVSEESFVLHVVRTSGDGTTYEGRIEHLSESEREIIGLVVALAGYLVHDVAERAPFMLLDSLEMIDGQRLVDLVSYLNEHVPYLVVVLLPDHAEAFESERAPEHHRISEI